MTITYTFDQLKDDVRKEAEALRVYATKEELANLDFENLEPDTKDSCIYGQLTGGCYSKRAATLIHSCAHRYFHADVVEENVLDLTEVTIDSVIKYAKGTRVKNFVKERVNVFSENTHYSAIEAYILLPEANNANLIAFLKGETDNLEL